MFENEEFMGFGCGQIEVPEEKEELGDDEWPGVFVGW